MSKMHTGSDSVVALKTVSPYISQKGASDTKVLR